jgi:hypothetical protein
MIPLLPSRRSLPTLVFMLLTLATTSTSKAQALPRTSAEPQTRTGSQSSTSASKDEIRKTLMRQPLHFEPAADGAMNGEMTSRTSEQTLRIGVSGKVEFAAPGASSLSMQLVGANAKAKPEGEDVLPGCSNYMIGNDSARWRSGVRQFGRVRVPAIYPGIDLVYYGNGSQLEHDYMVAANADPTRIRMQIQGANAVTDDKTGDLIMSQAVHAGADGERLRFLKPVAYQKLKDGTKRPITASYQLLANGDYGFSLGPYDHYQPLVIDPVILYASYFGGKHYDSIVDVKLGTDDSIYLLMTTDSTDLNTVGAPTGACAGQCGPTNPDNGAYTVPDMYVAKLDKTGQTLLFATYLGGSNMDQAFSLALDSDGSIYIAGTTLSADFPQVNAYPGGQPTEGGESTTGGILSKLSADGSKLLYSTYIGFGLPSAGYVGQVGDGTSHYMVTANNGIVYLLGAASLGSPDEFIWKKNALFSTGVDFVAEIDTTKSGTDAVLWATQVGDGNSAITSATLSSLALDSKGNVWLYGGTPDSAFPVATSGAVQPKCSTTSTTYCNSSFLMELNPGGTAVLYSSFLGGTNQSSGNYGNLYSAEIQIDAADNIYVSGSTNQADFPIKNGVYPTIPSDDFYGYLSKISADGGTLMYSTYLHSAGVIGVSSNGQVAFAGSSGAGFPLKNNLTTTEPSGEYMDGVFGLIDPTLPGDNSLLLSSYLGTTTNFTLPMRVLLPSSGQILMVGETYATDLPVINAYQATCSSCASDTGGDGFIAAIQPNDTLTLTPATITFPATSVGSTSAAMTATLYNGTTKSIYVKEGSLTDSKDFTHSDNCAILSPLTGCTITFTFTPQSAGTLTSTYTTGDLDNPSNPLTIALTGAANSASISVSPTSLAFGTVADGTTATQSVTVTNSGDSAAPISGASISGNAAFALTNNTCGASIAANATCQYSITFSPTAESPFTGTLTITDNLGTQVVQLTGTGGPAKASETLTPATVAFGNVYEGQTATQTVTFTNNGSAAVTISAATINPPVYSIVTTTCTSHVAAGASCTYTLSYNPIGVGSAVGSFTVTDGSSNPSVTLTGTGIQPISGDNVFLIPGSINFQSVVVGPLTESPYASLTFANQTSQTIQAQAKNYGITGANAPVWGQTLGYSGFCQYDGNGDYTITLAPYTSCIISVSFETDSAAADTTYTALYQVNWNYSGQTQLHYMASALTANTITPEISSVTPTTIQFPATPNGKTSPAQVVTITSSGDQPLSFAGATFNGTNPAAFKQTNNCPASLNKGTTCQISVYFIPGATGSEFTANMDVSLGTGDTTVTLSGGTSPSDFVLSSPTPPQGTTNAKWEIDVAPLTAAIGFNQPITFTVSGLDPSYGTPVFTPSTVTPKNGTVTTTLTLTQASPAALNHKPARGPGGIRTALPALAFCMAFLLGFRRKLKNYRTRIAAIIVVMGLTAFALTGCAQPAVNFTVTATSGSISHQITLTIQP